MASPGPFNEKGKDLMDNFYSSKAVSKLRIVH
jgi:hypothetical protein